MALRRPGYKPLKEPMVANLRIYASLGLNELKQFHTYVGNNIGYILPCSLFSIKAFL